MHRANERKKQNFGCGDGDYRLLCKRSLEKKAFWDPLIVLVFDAVVNYLKKVPSIHGFQHYANPNKSTTALSLQGSGNEHHLRCRREISWTITSNQPPVQSGIIYWARLGEVYKCDCWDKTFDNRFALYFRIFFYPSIVWGHTPASTPGEKHPISTHCTTEYYWIIYAAWLINFEGLHQIKEIKYRRIKKCGSLGKPQLVHSSGSDGQEMTYRRQRNFSRIYLSIEVSKTKVNAPYWNFCGFW